MMCVTTTDMRPEGFCEVRDCGNNINNTNNNNKKNSSVNTNNNCIADAIDEDSDVRDSEFNCKYISASCKIRNCDGNNNNVICDSPRRNRYIYRLVFYIYFIIIILVIFIIIIINLLVVKMVK